MVYIESMAEPKDIPRAAEIIKACYACDWKKVEDLLNAGDDVNTVDERDNLTCLHIACMQNDAKIVNVILRHNENHHDVDFSITSRYRPRYAWQYAMNAGHYELAQKVFVAGEDAKVRLERSPKSP